MNQDDLDAYLRYSPSSYHPKGDEDTFFSEGGLNHPEPFGTREMLELGNEAWHAQHGVSEEHRPVVEHRMTADERRILARLGAGNRVNKDRLREPTPPNVGTAAAQVREFSRPSDAHDPYGFGPISQADRFQMMGMGETDPDLVRFTERSGDPAAEMTRGW